MTTDKPERLLTPDDLAELLGTSRVSVIGGARKSRQSRSERRGGFGGALSTAGLRIKRDRQVRGVTRERTKGRTKAMMHESLEKLRRKVEEYSQTYRHPDLQVLNPLGPYALSPDDNFVTDPKMRWDQQWPNCRMPGLRSLPPRRNPSLRRQGVDHRQTVSELFRYEFPMTKDKRCRIVHAGWTHTPTYVCTIGVPKKSRFEASALEEYLIHELKPLDNIRIDPHWREDEMPAV